MSTMSNNKKIGFAIFIMFIGVIFLLDNLGIFYINIPYYFTQWYTILILVGLFLMLVRDKKGPGITLLIIGGLFLISDVSYISFWSLWPVLLIVAGVAILVRRNQASRI